MIFHEAENRTQVKVVLRPDMFFCAIESVEPS